MAEKDAKPAPKPKLPPGYADEAEFISEAVKRFSEAYGWDCKNRDEAKADLKFFAGDQWEKADVDARTGRPCLTINQLPQFVAQITGDMRINRPSIKVRPAEDADKDLADVREGLIRAIEQQSDALRVYVETGQAQVACGIGNFRAVLDYTSDDAFERDIFIRPIPNPFAVTWDPLITDGTGRDARYCFVGEDMPRDIYVEKYGPELPGGLGEDDSDWFSSDTVRITEYWIVKEVEAEIALLQDGSVRELTADNRAELTPLIQSNASGPMTRKTIRKTVCMYLISGTKILAKPVEYKLSRIPVFRVPGWEVDLGGGSQAKTRWGIVRFARDPTRLKNYWRSVMAEKLALAPRQQWLIHESQPGSQENFRTDHENGETVLGWAGATEPKRLDPPPIEAALIQESALNAQDMKDVTGLHDASLGARSNETSGKAILARQREGDVASYIYHDNLKAAIAECGKVVNEWIPAVYDTRREIRVLGNDDTQKVMLVNDTGNDESIDMSKGKYDVVVETGPSYSTRRAEASESMLAFVQAVPAAGQVAGDLIAKAQDWPMSEEIGERLKRTLPPQITQDPNEPPPPPDPAAQAQQEAAQQAQQMQMQGAALELKLKDAQARKAEADADKAEFEALKAHAELNNPQPQPAKPQPDPRLTEAQVSKAVAEADRAHIGAASDLLDLRAKPADQALGHASQVKALEAEPEEPKPAI